MSPVSRFSGVWHHLFLARRRRMSKRHQLNQLLENPRIWKAGQRDAVCYRQTLSTGSPDLDRVLSGGWPLGVLIELLVDLYGIGEFRLLMPVLNALSKRTEKLMMLIAPPYIPYAPAFAHRGMDISRLLIVNCHRRTDVLWATEQALRSGACAAVLAWSDGSDERLLRRLQLAAEEGASAEGSANERGGCWVVLFRPWRFRRQRSPAALRIALQPGRSSGISMNIFKNRGGQPQKLELSLPEHQ
jgi:protein ImuA